LCAVLCIVVILLRRRKRRLDGAVESSVKNVTSVSTAGNR
jgi:hypothetical protein